MIRRLLGAIGVQWSTIYGAGGDHSTPYMTRVLFGRLRLHIFHRSDADPDCHDHPWDFWTFPLVPYVEEVAVYSAFKALQDMQAMRAEGLTDDQINAEIAAGRKVGYIICQQLVPAWRWSFRPATHTHRVIGPLIGYEIRGGFYRRHEIPANRAAEIVDLVEAVAGCGPIVTIVWRSAEYRRWGFLKNRDGRWCWTDWRTYIYGGGKSAPCATTDPASADSKN